MSTENRREFRLQARLLPDARSALVECGDERIAELLVGLAGEGGPDLLQELDVTREPSGLRGGVVRRSLDRRDVGLQRRLALPLLDGPAAKEAAEVLSVIDSRVGEVGR